MDKKKFAFTKTNYILTAVGMAIIIIGLLLMTGPNSTSQIFETDIFSVRRIKVAPVVTLIGFITIIVAIAYKPKNELDDNKE
jgi:predicted cobalt transporter CbtA